MNNTLMTSERPALMSTVVTPRVATPWATPVCPPFGTELRDRSALVSMHSSRGGYTAGGSTNGIAVNRAAAAKQDRPPRGVPR